LIFITTIKKNILACEALKTAQKISEDLDYIHPLRLDVNLNLATFYYKNGEIENACHAAKDAYDNIITIREITEEEEAYLIPYAKLLRDYLTNWIDEEDIKEKKLQVLYYRILSNKGAQINFLLNIKRN